MQGGAAISAGRHYNQCRCMSITMSITAKVGASALIGIPEVIFVPRRLLVWQHAHATGQTHISVSKQVLILTSKLVHCVEGGSCECGGTLRSPITALADFVSSYLIKRPSTRCQKHMRILTGNARQDSLRAIERWASCGLGRGKLLRVDARDDVGRSKKYDSPCKSHRQLFNAALFHM